MNNEQQQIIDESYNNYLTYIHDVVQGENQIYGDWYGKEEFINKCKTNPEFSEKWGLKIDEKELSEGERGLLLQPLGLDPLTKEGRDRLWKENNLPTKKITITYNDKIIESYK